LATNSFQDIKNWKNKKGIVIEENLHSSITNALAVTCYQN
jgi:hypothetical protein